MQTNNPMELLKMLNGSQNPEMMFQRMIESNPNIKKTLMQIANSTQGASPEQIAKQMAQRSGISEEQLNQLYRQIKR